VDAPLFRLTLPPGSRTGLKNVSQVMIDKIVSVPRAAINAEIGECNTLELGAVADGLRRWLEL
jgi:mRNA interferase MazF